MQCLPIPPIPSQLYPMKKQKKNKQPQPQHLHSQGLGLVRRKNWRRDRKRYAPERIRHKVLDRDGYRCRYCGVEVTDKTANIDHVVPYHLGGVTTPENLVTACQDCNKAKRGSMDTARRLSSATPEEARDILWDTVGVFGEAERIHRDLDAAFDAALED